ncbi:MAG: peptide ABC transporter substrate-binding protein [Clostridia bacterium]|nr:peptide ABC transporter substrate-binding protein [Clostridia bacterium]
MKRIMALVLSLLLFSGILTSCSSDEPVVLFFPVESEAGTFDPQIVSDTTASIVVRNCFEGLLRKDENGETINGVAKSWKVSPDGLTYTFYLREDAVWHLTSNAEKQLEGKIPENFDLSVTANDFQFALERAVDPATGAHMSYMLYNIVNAPEILSGNKNKDELGVKAVDKYTLEIKLSQPQSNFPEVLTEPVCMPCNETFFKACSGRYGTLIAFSLSNGPFYLSRFDDTSYRINKAADYIGESEAVPDYVWLYVEEDEEKLMGELEADGYSGAVISEDMYKELDDAEKMTVIETPNVIRGFIMNLSDLALGEENIRKALAAATDIKKIAENTGKAPAQGIVPLSAAAEGVTTHPEAYSEEKAKVYLKSGMEKLETTSIDIVLLCEKRYEDAMRRLLQEWQRILGIYVNFSVKTGTPAEVKKAVETGNYQIAFYDYKAETDSAYGYFGTFTANSPYNITGFNGFGMEELLGKLYCGNEENFRSVYASVESKLSSASVIIPVWTENTYFVCTKDISGILYFSGCDKLYFHKATNK